jgi:tryptophan-rich sensory protein
MKSKDAGLTSRGAALLAGLLLLNLLVAALGGLFTASSVGSWYQEIVRPSWNPPGWIFGPVWTALYAMIAVAAWLAFRASDGLLRRRALRWYFIQLALNILWSPLFFGLRSPAAGLVGILLLDAAAIICAAHFRKSSRPAFALFLPYIAWLLFATVLNAEIWRLNAS